MFILKIVLFTIIVVMLFKILFPSKIEDENNCVVEEDGKKKIYVNSKSKCEEVNLIKEINKLILDLVYNNDRFISSRFGLGIASYGKPPKEMYDWRNDWKIHNFYLTYTHLIRTQGVNISLGKKKLEYTITSRHNIYDLLDEFSIDDKKELISELKKDKGRA